ncbi:MAG: SCO family protein [Bacteroidia bacterium]
MKKALLLLVILVLPSAIYIFLAAGKEKSFIRLAYYGPKKVIHITINGKAKVDTAFYQIPSFNFYDQSGSPFNSFKLKGKIWVAYFVHIHDGEKAPPMAVLMNRIEERTDLDTALGLVTFTLDSESAKSLQDYAATIHSGKRRFFLSGNAQALNSLAAEGFYKPVDTSYNNGYNHFFLIDKEGHIRGIYNGFRVKDIDKLVDEISMMEAEYFIKHEVEEEKEGKSKEHDAI